MYLGMRHPLPDLFLPRLPFSVWVCRDGYTGWCGSGAGRRGFVVECPRGGLAWFSGDDVQISSFPCLLLTAVLRYEARSFHDLKTKGSLKKSLLFFALCLISVPPKILFFFFFLVGGGGISFKQYELKKKSLPTLFSWLC